MGNGILRYIEYFLARLLRNVRGHDHQLFTHQEAFKDVPRNLDVAAPELGPEGSQMGFEYSAAGGSKFPELTWSLAAAAAPPGAAKLDGLAGGEAIKEYVLISEDPDVPIPNLAACHGIYYAIPPEKTHIRSEDISLDDSVESDVGAKWLKGGFRLGKNLRGSVYGGARPPVGHGGHRYFYQVVALKEKLDESHLSAVATKADILKEIQGKVLCWGSWYGVYENKW